MSHSRRANGLLFFAEMCKMKGKKFYCVLKSGKDMQQDAKCKFWALAVLLCGLCMRSGQSVLHRSGEAWRKGQQGEAGNDRVFTCADLSIG